MAQRQRRVILGILAAIAAVVIAAGSVYADSRLIYPRISFDAGTITGVTIANPNAVDATVTLRLYDSSGQLGQPPRERTVTVPARGQFPDVIQSLFPAALPPDEAGWIEATSSANNLTGFFLFLNGQLTLFDGADLPPVASQVVFNDVRVGGQNSTELSIVNPNPTPTSVVFELRGPMTALLPAFTVPGFGVLRVDPAEIFQVESFDQAASIAVSASNNVVGFELVRGSSDITGGNARPTSEVMNAIYFPQLAVRPPYVTQLTLNNYSDQQVLVEVTAHRGDGSLFGPEALAANPVGRLLGPTEVLSEDLEAMFGFFGPGPLEGWLEVKSTSQSINGTISYAIPALGSVAAVAAPAMAQSRALFSQLATSQGFFTGIAALNSGAKAANFRVIALRPNGSVLGSYEGVLCPGQRISKLINELIPASDGQAGGMIWVISNTPLYLTSLFGSQDIKVLANIPPQPVPGSFRPDAGIPNYSINPSHTVVPPQNSKALALSGPAADMVNWETQCAPANSEGGTVSAEGVFQAPDLVPPFNPQVVTASVSSQTVGSTIDVLLGDILRSGLSQVRSVAFLEGLQRLYTAELGGLGATALDLSNPLQDETTDIFDVTSDPKTLVTTVNGLVSKVVPFTGIDGVEYLLATDQTAGTLLRIEPEAKTVTTIRTGLASPTGVVVVGTSAFVSTATGIATVNPSELNAGLTAPAQAGDSLLSRSLPTADTKSGVSILEPPYASVAYDECSGRPIVSLAESGVVGWLFPDEIIATGLANPGQLLAFYRNSVPCPTSLHVLVTEQGLDQVTLLIPADGVVQPWLKTQGPIDISFVPAQKDIEPVAAARVLVADDETQEIIEVPVTELYLENTDNPVTGNTVSTYTRWADFEALGAENDLMTDEFDDRGTLIPPGTVRNGVEFTSFPRGGSGITAQGINGILFPFLGVSSLYVNQSGMTTLFDENECMEIRFEEPVVGVGIAFQIEQTVIPNRWFYISTPVGTAFGGFSRDLSLSPPFFFAGFKSEIPFTTAQFCGTEILPTPFYLDRLAWIRQR